MNYYPKPNWLTLFATLPVMVMLLFGESQWSLSPLGHHLVQIGIVLAFVGLLGLWTTFNSAGLLYEESVANDARDDETEAVPGAERPMTAPPALPQPDLYQLTAHSGKYQPAYWNRERLN